jgi:hypothetical protein
MEIQWMIIGDIQKKFYTVLDYISKSLLPYIIITL